MKSTDFQAYFAQGFASQAETGTLTWPVPATKPGSGRVSLGQGFPVETMTPIAAGGVPPHGADMNGVLRMLSMSCQRSEMGVVLPFSEAFAAAVGGYPVHALVSWGAEGAFYLSGVDNNLSVPGTKDSQWKPLLDDCISAVPYNNAADKIRSMAINWPSDAAGESISVTASTGQTTEIPSQNRLEARISTCVRSERVQTVDRLVRTLRIDPISDARGCLAYMEDEDGSDLALPSLPVSEALATQIAATATETCVRSAMTDTYPVRVEQLIVTDASDTEGRSVQAACSDGGTIPLTSEARVTQMIVDGCGLNRQHDTPGYAVLPGGVIIQWGRYKTDQTLGLADVTFPVAYPASCAIVVLCESDARGTWPNATPTVHGVENGWTRTGFTATTRLFVNAGQNLPHEASGGYISIGY